MATEIKINLETDFALTEIERFNTNLKKTEKITSQIGDDFNRFGQGFSRGLQESSKSLSTLDSAIIGVGTTIASVFAVNRIVGFFSDAIDQAKLFESSLLGVNTVAKSFGQDIDLVQKAVKDFTADGLVSATESALAFKQVLSTGTDLPTAIKLLNSLKDAAAFNRQSFYSLGEAIIATTEGIKNGNSVKADAVGITKNLSVLEKEYAESIGTTVGKLTAQQEIQARVTGFIREASIFTGDAQKLTETYSGSIAKLNANFNLFLANLGELVTKSPLVINALSGLSDIIGQFARLGKTKEPIDRINELKLAIKELEKPSSIPFLNSLRSGTIAKATAEIKELQKQINEAEIGKTTGKKLKEFNDSIDEQIKFAKQRSPELLSAVKGENDKLEAERVKLYEKLKEELKNAGLTELEILKAQRDERLAIAKDDAVLKEKILLDFNQRRTKILEAQGKKEKAFNVTLLKDTKELAEAQARELSRVLDPASGAAQSILKGDARSFISQGIKSAGAAFGPEGAAIAQAAGPVFELLSQGKEAVKQAISQFAEQLPDLLVNIIEGLAEAIPLILEKLPMIVERLVELLPRIITALGESMPRVAVALATGMPMVAVTFATELIEQAPNIAKAIIEAIAKTPSNAVKSVGKFLKFSDGGVVAGGSFSGDRLLAGVNSGEMVLNRKQQANLFDLIDRGNGQESSNLLNAFNALVSQPIIVQVDGREIARVVRNQRKQGFVI